MKLIKVIFVFLGIHFSVLVHAVEIQCGRDHSSSFPYSYCLHEVSGSTNRDVLYYFHGNGGDEFEWSNAAQIDHVYRQWGNKAPAVITISYGPSWLLAEKNSSPVSGMFEHFVSVARPTIEEKFKLVPEHRLLFGLSMGGFNASQLYLKQPQLFSKVALACPAILPISPDARIAEIFDYSNRTHATIQNVFGAVGLMRLYFPTHDDWSTADPIELANQVDSNFPEINVSCGDRDEYGFFEGAEKFSDVIASQQGKVTWTLLPGGHCVFDVDKLIKFFVP